MPNWVRRRRVLTLAAPAVAATSGCLGLLGESGECEGVSIVGTELEGENPMGENSATIHVTVLVTETNEYTLIGQIETSNGRETIERTLEANSGEQTFAFGPYDGVHAFEFHVEGCME